ncbi:hypothetical protein MDA_GLEAN10001782 [Myotis davidii]|uniref:Uncharacterized protein n=1 Tax=Myotis davidii TaxID=225400 RepID=L5M516_MYODS|nr:hypothetical protein MDA_GLEAN10001782 [Myotis davidii]
MITSGFRGGLSELSEVLHVSEWKWSGRARLAIIHEVKTMLSFDEPSRVQVLEAECPSLGVHCDCGSLRKVEWPCRLTIIHEEKTILSFDDGRCSPNARVCIGQDEKPVVGLDGLSPQKSLRKGPEWARSQAPQEGRAGIDDDSLQQKPNQHSLERNKMSENYTRRRSHRCSPSARVCIGQDEKPVVRLDGLSPQETPRKGPERARSRDPPGWWICFSGCCRRFIASVGHKTLQSLLYTELPRRPVSLRTPPADKTCLAEQWSCWAVIAETLLWAW